MFYVSVEAMIDLSVVLVARCAGLQIHVFVDLDLRQQRGLLIPDC